MHRAALPIALLAFALLGGCLDPDAAVDAGDEDGQGPGDRTLTGTGTRTAGSSSGNVTGNGTGNATGNQTGNATGNGTGNATGNQTGNATGNGTGNVSYEWRYDNRTGTIAGGLAPTLDPPDTKTEAFNVTNGTRQLLFNLSASGEAAVMTITPPGCTTDACRQEEEVGTSAPVLVNVTAPANGTWEVEVAWDGNDLVNGGTCTYKVHLGAEVAVPGNATANQTGNATGP
jgi:hypothetical protein